MNDKNKIFAYWLSTINGVGQKTIEKLLDYFDSEMEIFNAEAYKFYNIKGIRPDILKKIINSMVYFPKIQCIFYFCNNFNKILQNSM